MVLPKAELLKSKTLKPLRRFAFGLQFVLVLANETMMLRLAHMKTFHQQYYSDPVEKNIKKEQFMLRSHMYVLICLTIAKSS